MLASPSELIFNRSTSPIPLPPSPQPAWPTLSPTTSAALWPRIKSGAARRDLRQAQRALGHKRLETTVRHYVLDSLEGGLTDGLY